MNKEKIFKNIKNITPYEFEISDSFDLYFGQSKINKNKKSLTKLNLRFQY